MIFVPIKTILQNGDEHNVTLMQESNGTVTLLGSIPHGSTIIVNDELIEGLKSLKSQEEE